MNRKLEERLSGVEGDFRDIREYINGISFKDSVNTGYGSIVTKQTECLDFGYDPESGVAVLIVDRKEINESRSGLSKGYITSKADSELVLRRGGQEIASIGPREYENYSNYRMGDSNLYDPTGEYQEIKGIEVKDGKAYVKVESSDGKERTFEVKCK